MGVLAFLTNLISEIETRRRTVMVITDTGGQPAYAASQQEIEAQLKAAPVFHEVLGRKVSDYDPIGDETAEVLTRRLFERVEHAAAEQASAQYHATYRRLREEEPGLLPADAATAEYAARIVRCYPFHPRLLDTAQGRLGALQDFKTSGSNSARSTW